MIQGVGNRESCCWAGQATNSAPLIPGRTQVAEASGKKPEAETPSKEKQLDKEPVPLNRRFSELPSIILSSLALIIIGGVAIYVPEFKNALPE